MSLLAIDQGTTGTTCLVLDEGLRIPGRGYREVRQSYPQPGWVEHDPDEICAPSTRRPPTRCATPGSPPHDLAAVGITNQRETTVVWSATAARSTPRSSGRTGGRRSGAASFRPA